MDLPNKLIISTTSGLKLAIDEKKSYINRKNTLLIDGKNGNIDRNNKLDTKLTNEAFYLKRTCIITKHDLKQLIKGKKDLYIIINKSFCNICQTWYYYRTSHQSSGKHNTVKNISNNLETNNNNHLVLPYIDENTNGHPHITVDVNKIANTTTKIHLQNNTNKEINLIDITYTKPNGNSYIYHSDEVNSGIFYVTEIGQNLKPNGISKFHLDLISDAVCSSSDHKYSVRFQYKGCDHTSTHKISHFKNYEQGYSVNLNKTNRDTASWRPPVSNTGVDKYNKFPTNPHLGDLITPDIASDLNKLETIMTDKIANINDKNFKTGTPELDKYLYTLREETTPSNMQFKYSLLNYLEYSKQILDLSYVRCKTMDSCWESNIQYITIDAQAEQLNTINLKIYDKTLIKHFQDDIETISLGVITEIKTLYATIKVTHGILQKDTHIKLAGESKFSAIRANLNAITNTTTKTIEYLFPTTTYHHIDWKTFCNDEQPAVIPFTGIPSDAQNKVVLGYLTHSFGDPPLILRGPPGTGKTKCIINAVFNTALTSEGKILIVLHTNNGVNDFYKKIKLIIENDERLQHLQVTKLVIKSAPITPTCKKYCTLTKDKLGHEFPSYATLSNSHIIITTYGTSPRLGYITTENGDYAHIKAVHLFLEEAGYPSEDTIAIPINTMMLMDNKPLKIMISGDEKQLQYSPRSLIGSQTRNTCIITRLMNTDLYKQNKHLHHTLTTNYRSDKNIVDFLAGYHYDNQLTANSTEKGTLAGIHVDTIHELSEGSAVSLPEAMMAVQLGQHYTNLGKSVTILSYYCGTLFLIKKLMYFKGITNICCYTTESVQGLESDIVILVTSIRNEQSLWHENNRRLAVAISRSSHQFILIADFNKAANIKAFKPLITHMHKEKEITCCQRTRDQIANQLYK